MRVKLNDVRLCFPNLFTPKTVGEHGNVKFSAAFPVVPGSKNNEVLNAAIMEVSKAQWKDKAAVILKELTAKGKVCFMQEALSKEGKVYDGFEGMYTFNASNTAKPLVVDKDRSLLTEEDGKPYAGCYVNVIVDIWAQDNKYGKRINAQLCGVQFFRDGDAFSGGGKLNPEEFDSLEVGADATEFD